MSQWFITVDLGFGDQGKGSIVSGLVQCYGAEWVVRYNGGPQCSHMAYAPDGRKHPYAQFGAGTFLRAKTYQSRYMLVEPYALFEEAKALEKLGVKNPLSLIYTSDSCRVITPFHWAMNRIREVDRGNDRHGSCGRGIGECMADAQSGLQVFVADFHNMPALVDKLRAIREHKREALRHAIKQETFAKCDPIDVAIIMDYDDSALGDCLSTYIDFTKMVEHGSEDILGDAMRTNQNVVFEGAQGVLLDELYGFNPYTTWSSCTTRNASNLLIEHDIMQYMSHPKVDVTTVGILRAYATRHGKGPFPSEYRNVDPKTKEEANPWEQNGTNEWQGDFRVGRFDAVLARYALACCRQHLDVDILALTCLDVVENNPWKFVVDEYDIPDGRVVTHLNIPENLEQSTINTNLVSGAKLKTTSAFIDTGSFIDHVEKATGYPVGIQSWGPMAKDKLYVKMPEGMDGN